MKPMSPKQRGAIQACEYLLGVKYEGADTAQGAFLFLREYINKAREELSRRIAEEQVFNRSLPVSESDAVKQMAFYRYDNAEHDLGDEDDTYAETPTLESAQRDAIYWSLYL
jgi:hypothetical protein